MNSWALAARAADIVPIDTPYVRVHDLDGLRVFARRARDESVGASVVAEVIGPHAETVDHIEPFLTLYGLALAGRRIHG